MNLGSGDTGFSHIERFFNENSYSWVFTYIKKELVFVCSALLYLMSFFFPFGMQISFAKGRKAHQKLGIMYKCVFCLVFFLYTQKLEASCEEERYGLEPASSAFCVSSQFILDMRR